MPFFERSKGAIVNGSNFIDINGSGNVVHVAPDPREHPSIELD